MVQLRESHSAANQARYRLFFLICVLWAFDDRYVLLRVQARLGVLGKLGPGRAGFRAGDAGHRAERSNLGVLSTPCTSHGRAGYRAENGIWTSWAYWAGVHGVQAGRAGGVVRLSNARGGKISASSARAVREQCASTELCPDLSPSSKGCEILRGTSRDFE